METFTKNVTFLFAINVIGLLKDWLWLPFTFPSPMMTMTFILNKSLTNTVKIHNMQAFTSEFSAIRAIGQIKQLRAMLTSDRAQAKKVANLLLKTTAIMQQLGGGSGYQSYQHPRLTASAMNNLGFLRQ